MAIRGETYQNDENLDDDVLDLFTGDDTASANDLGDLSDDESDQEPSIDSNFSTPSRSSIPEEPNEAIANHIPLEDLPPALQDRFQNMPLGNAIRGLIGWLQAHPNLVNFAHKIFTGLANYVRAHPWRFGFIVVNLVMSVIAGPLWIVTVPLRVAGLGTLGPVAGESSSARISLLDLLPELGVVNSWMIQ